MSTDGYLGNILNGFLNIVNRTIQQDINMLQNAGMELEIQAGEQVSRAISEIANTYQDQLNKTIDKISTEAKNAFNDAQSLVQNFQNSVGRDLNKIMGDAQQLVNTLPFASKQPQLTSITPRFLVITDVASSCLVTFNGNFPWSSQPGYAPTLSFGNITCPLIDSPTQSLTFSVPQSIFDAAINSDTYNYATGSLFVPWEKTEWYVWKTKAQSAYQIALGALPTIAGNGAAVFTATNTQRVTQPKGGNYRFNGNSYYPEEYHTVVMPFYPDPGWTIDTAMNVEMTPHVEHGEFFNPTITVTPSEITLTVKLYCAHGHDISILNIDLGFTQFKDQTVTSQRQQPFQVGWTGSQLLVPQANEQISSLSFMDYNGTPFGFAGPQNDERCVLKVIAEGNGAWQIYAEPPTNLTATLETASPQLREEAQKVIRLKELLKASNLVKHNFRLVAPTPAPIAHLQALQLQMIAQNEVQRQLSESSATEVGANSDTKEQVPEGTVGTGALPKDEASKVRAEAALEKVG